MLPTIIVALKFYSKTRIGQKVNVYVTNNLTDLQLGVDCKDKNYDFGFQTLKFQESYIFRFVPSFLIKKLIFL